MFCHIHRYFMRNFIGELIYSFENDIRRNYSSAKTRPSESTYIPLIAECYTVAKALFVFANTRPENSCAGLAIS